jgi:RHS repeat-associated protein
MKNYCVKNKNYCVNKINYCVNKLIYCVNNFGFDIQPFGCTQLASPQGSLNFVNPYPDLCNLQGNAQETDLFYYHPDHLGSTGMVTDNSSIISQGFLYAPFGEIISEYTPGWETDRIPKYAFNAKELDEENGMYYYSARYYAPPTFISRDPMFEKYPSISPYTYCANNPMKYVDPSGEKVAFAGDAEEQAYNNYRAEVFSSDEYKDIQDELTKLEDAEEIFRIRMGENVTDKTGGGNLKYNFDTKEIDVNIVNEGPNGFSTKEKLSHELKHADQYLNREIGFDLANGDCKTIAYDREDEYEAYARQGLFGNTMERHDIFTSKPYQTLPDYGYQVTIDNIGGYYDFNSIVVHNKNIYNKSLLSDKNLKIVKFNFNALNVNCDIFVFLIL